MMLPVRALVSDDRRLNRDGIPTRVNVQPPTEIAGTAANGQEAVVLAAPYGWTWY
jgi:hypothetical protein